MNNRMRNWILILDILLIASVVCVLLFGAACSVNIPSQSQPHQYYTPTPVRFVTPYTPIIPFPTP